MLSTPQATAAWIALFAISPLNAFGSSQGGAIPEGLTAAEWSGIRAACIAQEQVVETTANGFRARVHGQGLTVDYDVGSVTATPDSGDWTWGLELARWGFEGHSIVVDEARSARVDGGRVSLVWSERLTEWWLNDASSVEHGFTVQSRPDRGAHAGPLRFTLDVVGGLRPEIAEGRRSAHFVDGEGEAALSYEGLVAFDAEGRDLEAWMEAGDGCLTLCVDERRATYPITVDPIVQSAYIKASNSDSNDLFGLATALSGDTLVVGAYFEDSSSTGINSTPNNFATRAGAVYVFTRTASSWEQQAYIKPFNSGFADQFGRSVDISGDTMVVGAISEDSAGRGVNSGLEADNSRQDSGAAYIFTRTGTTWSQQAYLKAPNADIDDGFGLSVAVDGDTVVVSAAGESSSGTGVNGPLQSDNSSSRSGAAYVFVRTGTTWSVEAYVKASNTGSFDGFGRSVDIDGDTAVVSAFFEDSGGTGVNGGGQADNSASSAGAAYVFVRNGAVWSQEAYLKASNTDAGDTFGNDAALSGDTLVVSADGESSAGAGVNSGLQADNSSPSSGAVYVFKRTSGGWAQDAYLKASNTDAGDRFGASVAVSAGIIVVGAVGESSSGAGVNSGTQGDNSAPYTGAGYVFREEGGSWVQTDYLKAQNSDPDDFFGLSVSIDENLVLVGAPREDSRGSGVNSGLGQTNGRRDAGAVYLFEISPGSNYCAAALNSTGAAAAIAAQGSAVTARNNLALTATALPPDSFGFFLNAPVTGFTANPGGSAGNLCLGGTIGRYVGQGQIQNSGSAGSFSLVLDLTQHPTPSGLVAIRPGETWHFTAWFRDSVGAQATSNFTDGLTIDFQ